MVLGWASEGKWGENLRKYNVLGSGKYMMGRKAPSTGGKCLQSKEQLTWLGMGMALASSIDCPGRPALFSSTCSTQHGLLRS